MRSRLKITLLIVGVLLSLLIMLYPTISNAYNKHLTLGDAEAYEKMIDEQLSEEEVTQTWLDAVTYNQHLVEPEVLESMGLEYEKMLNPSGNGVMGYLNIPKIRVTLPIRHTYEDGVLQNSVGHVETTALPVGGKGTRCVLAGHTGLASAKLLSNLDQLKLGDTFNLQILDQTLYYRVAEIAVVLPHEVDHIRTIEGEDLVTIITCTPYGVNSHRLLVTGRRIDESEGLAADGRLLVSADGDIISPLSYAPTAFAIVLVAFGFGYVLYMLIVPKRRRNEE